MKTVLSIFFLVLVVFYVSCFPPFAELPCNEGQVEDCQCKVEVVNDVVPSLEHHLKQVVSHKFFSFFKVNIFKECSFWVENMLCGLTEGGGCGVCICEEDEIPKPWKEEEKEFKEDSVDVSLRGLEKWSDKEENFWTNDRQDDPESMYINLQLNPERFTGYTGYNATRIWTAIYKENCFLSDEDQCFEERVFFRLISGFHGSTTLHICENYHDSETDEWYPHTEMYKWRLAAFPDRINNVYFTFLFLLRATIHTSSFLETYHFDTGDPEDDTQLQKDMKELLKHEFLQSCIPTFDETRMFNGDKQVIDTELKHKLRAKFRNISDIMDCVGCESCKLHAKLQLLGIGTALKILLAEDYQRSSVIADLQRNEIIALFNTLHKFAESVRIVQKMEARLKHKTTESALIYLGIALLALLLFAIFYLNRHCIFKQKKQKQKTTPKKKRNKKR